MVRADPPPVQVRFTSLYQPNTSALAESLLPFGRWSASHIAQSLPVTVSNPAEISERLSALEGYLASGGWPRHVPRGAISTIRAVVERIMPCAVKDITRGIRLTAAAALRDDGSRAVAERDQILSSFLASKMVAIARALCGTQLDGEPRLDWGAEFYKIGQAFSDRLIYGLSFLARDTHGWAGWTDANLWIDETSYRIFAPIYPDPEDPINVETLAKEDVLRLIIPQLLCTNSSAYASFLTIRRLVFEPWATFTKDLDLREKAFVDAQTCSDDPDANFLTTIVADRIATRLQQIPPKERQWHLTKMTFGLISPEHEDRVREKVRKKVTFD
jgi:hypothetical protein